MLVNCLAVVNSKGGVGKTSIVANIAGTAASGGWRTLAVDLDPQGNLARDLGYWDTSDDGQSLAQLLAGRATKPRPQVRPRLDVLAGGSALQPLTDVEAPRHDLSSNLKAGLASIGGQYDLIVLDVPPSAGLLQQAALSAAHFALIPTKADDASIDGLEGLARQIGQVRQRRNPDLLVIGVVLFDLGAGDHRLRAEARHELQDLLGDLAPVLTTTVRHSRRAARDMRREGKIAYEYEESALTSPRWIDDRSAPRFSTAATGLAADYQQLTDEVLSAIATRMTGEGVSA